MQGRMQGRREANKEDGLEGSIDVQADHGSLWQVVPQPKCSWNRVHNESISSSTVPASTRSLGRRRLGVDGL